MLNKLIRLDILCALLIFISVNTAQAQLTFFNMPNHDMFQDVGYSYAEYDVYQSVKNNNAVNAQVFRIMVQPLKFMEMGTNIWFNKELPSNPDKIVLSTKWRVWLYKNEKVKLSLVPGSWTSFYFDKNIPIKNIGYAFLGFSVKHTEDIYTRLMFGAYGKYWKHAADLGQDKFTSGFIAGLEQRLSKKLVFVTDYFQGSGEGFGLATGFVFYAMNKGTNLPLYLAYQFDNDSRKNDLMIGQIGYFFRAFKKKEK